MTSSKMVGTVLVCAALAVLNARAFAADDAPVDTASALGTLPADSAVAQTSTSPDSAVAAQPSETAPTLLAAATPPPDRFAFADNPLPWKPFALGAGIGAAAYTTDLQEVDRVFGVIENAYRAQGWTIPPASPAKLEVMRLYSMTARIEKVADLTVQLGRSGGDQDQLRTSGVIVSRRIVSSSGGNVALVAGAGAGTYGFVFNRSNRGASPVDANGGYTTLDWIELQGSSSYWTGIGGFKIRPGRHLAIDLQAQYVGMKPVSANTPQTGDVSIDLSGYCLGASVAFFL